MNAESAREGAPENTAAKQLFTGHRTARNATAARYDRRSTLRLWWRMVRLERRVEALERRVDELARTCGHGAR